MDKDAILEGFTSTKALLQGHFELRSGLHSNQYFQCAMVLQQPRVAADLCEALAKMLQENVEEVGRIDGVIAPAMGGIVIGHEVARQLGVRSIFAEKENDKLVLRRGFKIGPGDRYVIAEDVITRGGRVQETIDIVTERTLSNPYFIESIDETKELIYEA